MFENTDKKKVAERVEQIERGIALRKIRKSLGVSKEIFGEMLGISEEEVEYMEYHGIEKDKLQQIQETYRP